MQLFYLPKTISVKSNAIFSCAIRNLSGTLETDMSTPVVPLQFLFQQVLPRALRRCQMVKGGHRLERYAAVGSYSQEQSRDETLTTDTIPILQHPIVIRSKFHLHKCLLCRLNSDVIWWQNVLCHDVHRIRKKESYCVYHILVISPSHTFKKVQL